MCDVGDIAVSVYITKFIHATVSNCCVCWLCRRSHWLASLLVSLRLLSLTHLK